MNLVNKMIPVMCFLFLLANQAIVKGDSLESSAATILDELQATSMDAVLFWNLVSLQVCANEFNGALIKVKDQGPPTFTSRAYAIIHGAMYDAMNACKKGSKTLFKLENITALDQPPISTLSASISQAAYQTLCALYPKQKVLFDLVRDGYLKKLINDGAKQTDIDQGTTIGQAVASQIVKLRENDGSTTPGLHVDKNLPGYHLVDPLHPKQSCLCPSWGEVKPFILNSGSQFRSPNIIGRNPTCRQEFLKSKRYLDNYHEVKSLGGLNSTARTDEQTEIAIYWGYDGAPKIGVPPRLYNQIARLIAIQKNNTLAQNARLLALVNYVNADATIVAWDTKYYYDLWRPIVAVRAGSVQTPAEPNWVPFGAPADGAGDNFTPNFPSFVSGHAVFGSGTFEILRRFYKTDAIPFEFQSDEYNGKTRDSVTGEIRPAKSRSFETLSQAEEENFLSRIYLGIHWRIDQEHGAAIGRSVASYIFDNMP